MNVKKPGKVYLIGAGPGDPGLITVKGKQLLDKCQAIIYDNLVPSELIVALPDDVQRFYVGKKAGVHPVPQEKINELMLKLAREGCCVARLKGSDPLIFGRGGEEAKFLKEHGIPFEIVTGVTSGVAGPNYAGIPCTDRYLASSVIFLTGHKASDKYKSSVAWEWVAEAKNCTVVIYMGVGEIANIVRRLINNGMAADTPAAIIERGTFPSQRIFTGNLRRLPDIVAAENVTPPALFVIGQVVTLRPWLDWFDGRPLSGIRVMVLRPADQAGDLYERLRELGAEPMPYPTIATATYDDPDGWSRMLKTSADKNWLVFTSANGVRYFFDQFVHKAGDIRHLARFKIAVVGPATSQALLERHVEADFVASRATGDDLAHEMAEQIDLSGAVVIRVRGDLARTTIEDTLPASGATVIPLTVYRTYHRVWPDGFKDKLFDHPPHAVLFTSASTVKGLADNLTDDELHMLMSDAKIFSLGPMVTRTLTEVGFESTREANPHTIPGLIDTLLDIYTKRDA